MTQLPCDGILVLNKPRGPTSHQAVMAARRRLGIRRIGHGGTLDPMAEGVLVLLIGAATRQQQLLQQCRKVYEADVRLGAQTNTGDAWGTEIRRSPVPAIDRPRIERVLASLVGPLSQTPPAFSAVKVGGRPLYWWARKGRPVEAKPRPVEIFSATLVELGDARLRCRIACSSGTYIRTLAETIAERIGTVGHVDRLIRLAVGPWTIERAKDLEWLADATDEDIRHAVVSREPSGIDDGWSTAPVASRAWP